MSISRFRAATTCVKIRRGTPQENLAEWLKVVDKAGAVHPDVIVLSETVYERGCGLKGSSLGESIPGPLTSAMADKAKKYGAYIAFSMFERVDSATVYNTAVLLGRDGGIAGIHHKTVLANDEKEILQAGTGYRVFDTDIGRVGLMVCKELTVADIPAALKDLGADIILAPTIGDYSNRYSGIARENKIYLIVSGQDCKSEDSRPSIIVGPSGEIICSTVDHSSIAGEYSAGDGSVAWADIGGDN